MDYPTLPGIYSKPLRSTPIKWQGGPIKVVSLGCGSHSTLTSAAIADLKSANVIFGSPHHFEEISQIETNAERICFPSPFSKLRNTLEACQDKQIIVLASGDALFYGVGIWLIRLIGDTHLIFHPNISSIQYCFHALKLPWQHAEIVSLHGRPLHSLRRHIKPRHLIAVLTDRESRPQVIANELVNQGYGESNIWVCEAMAQNEQNITQFSALELLNHTPDFNSLNTCIIQFSHRATRTHRRLPTFPGIADEDFITGSEPGFGMISKREIRLTILALMSPENGEIAWDIGAGCGSVSVEWARWNNQGQIYAIEHNEQRIDHLIANSEKFGTTLNLTPIQGEAPKACDSLPDPDSIFIGGSTGLDQILDFAWQRLKSGGKLVASSVTKESRQSLEKFMADKSQRQWITLEVEKNLPGKNQNRKLKPVTIAACKKRN